jgi:hypothetical protein
MSKIEKKRRLGRTIISLIFLEKYLKLSPGHKIVGIRCDGFDLANRQTQLLLEGPELPEGKEGDPIPHVQVKTRQYRRYSEIIETDAI